MYKVIVDLNCTISGCPSSGVDAAEFRALHGIPEAPNNRAHIKFQLEGEGAREICRQNRNLLDADADLVIGRAWNGANLHDRLMPIRNKTRTHEKITTEYRVIRAGYRDLQPKLVADCLAVREGEIATTHDATIATLKSLTTAMALADEADRLAAEKQIAAWQVEDEAEAEAYANECIAKKEKLRSEQLKVEADKELLYELVSSIDFDTETNPLETIRLKREEGYHWVGDALEEYKNHMIRCLIVSEVEEVSSEDEEDCVKVEDLKKPSGEDILFVRRIRHDLKEHLPSGTIASAELKRVTYQSDDDEAWSRNEVLVTINLFGQWTVEFYLNCPDV